MKYQSISFSMEMTSGTYGMIGHGTAKIYAQETMEYEVREAFNSSPSACQFILEQVALIISNWEG